MPTTARTGAVALVLDTGVPAHPPNVALVAQHAGRQIEQPGAPYTHDWTIGGVANLWGSDFPVPWPSASAIGGADEPVLTFDTPSCRIGSSYGRTRGS